jgi:hypothetical protein
MARGKHLSFEEGHKSGQLKQFAKEHPSQGDWDRFHKLHSGGRVDHKQPS